MENNIIKISLRIQSIINELFPVVVGDDAIMEAIHKVSQELLSEFGEFENKEKLVEILMDMFLSGMIISKKKYGVSPE